MNTESDPTPEQAALSRDATGAESESIEDIRKFIGSLSTRTCEEAIGLSARGGLVSALIQATFGFVVVLVAFTAIPWWIGSADEPATAATPTAETEAQVEDPVEPPTTTTAGEASPDESKIDLSKAADALGIDQTKTASPDDNPLDKNLDNLLDGID